MLFQPCHQRPCPYIARKSTLLKLLTAGLILLAGCSNKKTTDLGKLTTRYQSQPLRTVPEYLKGTVLERADLANTAPYPVSGYGLISGLHGSGDTTVGNNVREYMLKQMVTHGFGSRLLGMERIQPEVMLRDPNVSIVSVVGYIPPGARRHQPFDVFVSAIDGNNTSSLAHGRLYGTELKVNGANPQAPGYSVDVWAEGAGDVFVNPAYAMRNPLTDAEARMSLRQGIVIGGGTVFIDRPLNLVMRQPSMAMSRTIDYRIDQAFQDPSVAAAKDEGRIAIYVPAKYGSDWEHFAQVVMHLFINSSPEFAAIRAKQLAEEAVKPNAPLLDISYCWEAFGPTVLPSITPLLNHEKKDVAYAAARAAAFLGDSAGQDALMAIAAEEANPFQESAVQTLGKLPSSPEIDRKLRTLLDSNQNGVRLEAYRSLAMRGDPSIVTHKIVGPAGDSFYLDIVPSTGTPIVYATRTGTPRIALVGKQLEVSKPILFMAMDNQLSVSADENAKSLDVYYRGPEIGKPVSVASDVRLDQFVAHLGGQGEPGKPKLQFGYCDVVSILQEMAAQSRLTAQVADGRTRVIFRLQDPPRVERTIDNAPDIPEPGAAVSTAEPVAR